MSDTQKMFPELDYFKTDLKRYKRLIKKRLSENESLCKFKFFPDRLETFRSGNKKIMELLFTSIDREETFKTGNIHYLIRLM